MLIRESLQGKRVLLTGATGFLGSGLLERLLFDVGVERVDVVIRGRAEERLQWLLRGSAFGSGRSRLGDGAFEDLVSSKLKAIPADIAEGPPAVADDIDLVIHSAATVSFDPPINEAFSVNLLGTTNLYEEARPRPFLHVSTAYVAGLTRGTQPEELLRRDVDWRAEADFAQRLASDAESESRKPEVLDRLASKARKDMSKAGPQSVASRTEELRRDWVARRAVRAGQARARSVGWPDVYTFTKALTEIALDELAGDDPLTIVRPSIIESAVAHPFPGWIEGFRMADPVMLGFGRGALEEFPGIPEGVLDIVPVDLVVNLILAAGASGMDQRRRVFHICTGHRNPLRFRDVYEHTRNYFLAHPLPERDRGTYKVPTWSFPGRKAIDRRLRTAERLIEAGERLTTRLPRSAFAREAARRVDRFRRRFDFAKRYADLYGPYAEIEVIYTDDRARELFESLPEDDRRDFPFDPTAFDWDRYFGEVHLPMLTAPVRWPEPTRPEPRVEVVPNGSGDPLVLAAFDIEGTIVDSNVVEAYSWLRLSELDDPAERAAMTASILTKVPGWLVSEKRDRGEFLRSFYRRYEGVPEDQLRELAGDVMGELVLRKMSAAAARRIREHRRAGHRIIFITGSLDLIVEPITFLADEVVAARLASRDGRFTGDLDRPPLVGEARSSWLTEYAKKNGADLSRSYAYADSLSDLPLLEAVGSPVAVNPDVALTRIARGRKWPIEEWEPEGGAPPILFPAIAPGAGGMNAKAGGVKR